MTLEITARAESAYLRAPEYISADLDAAYAEARRAITGEDLGMLVAEAGDVLLPLVRTADRRLPAILHAILEDYVRALAERGADLRNPHVSDSTAAAMAAIERLL